MTELYEVWAEYGPEEDARASLIDTFTDPVLANKVRVGMLMLTNILSCRIHIVESEDFEEVPVAGHAPKVPDSAPDPNQKLMERDRAYQRQVLAMHLADKVRFTPH